MVLKHRDTEVLRFEWLEPDGVRVTSVNERALRFLPLEMHGEPTDEQLWRWLRHRIVPKHRNYIQEMLLELGISYGVRSIIEISKGLSLNDVHWVCNDRSTDRWSAVNLYENPFSKTMAILAFTGGGRNQRLKTAPETSPEFSTNGMLAKCWRRTEKGIVLYKSGSEHFANAGFEPYSEYYAAQIAEALGYPHVTYGLERFKGRLCSTCPLFTSEKIGFVPAGRVASERDAISDPRFAEMFFFDALIFNTDRHLGNFGYLVDNDTNEIVGAAPIFDNGYGLFSLALDRPEDACNHEWDDLRKYARKIGPSLYAPWLAFPGGVTTAMKSAAMKLKGFRFARHPNYNLPSHRLQKLEEFLQNRVFKIVEFGGKADMFLLKEEKNGGERLADSGVDDALFVRRKIVQNVEADPYISQEELSQIIGVSLRSIQRMMAELKKQGVVSRKGSGRIKSWVVVRKALSVFFSLLCAWTCALAGEVRYLANGGNDAADGKTPATAWRTIEKANADLPGGATLLLKRGDVFYGGLVPKGGIDAAHRTTIADYGEGAKPVISCVKIIRPDPSVWKDFSHNFWRVNLNDPANYTGMTSNDCNSGFLLVDGVVHGWKRFCYCDLVSPWDFASEKGWLYVHATNNPALLAKDIRVALGVHGVLFDSHTAISNIAVHATGAHGMTGGWRHSWKGRPIGEDVRISDCDFENIGGEECMGFSKDFRIRAGNGIEFGSNWRDAVIERCTFKGVYDVAFTMQGSPNLTPWRDIHMRNCTITDCTQAFEVWCKKPYWCKDKSEALGFERCSFTSNHTVRVGGGWGAKVRPMRAVATPLLMYAMEADKVDITVTGNTFEDAPRGLIYKLGGAEKLPKDYRVYDNICRNIGPGQVVPAANARPKEKTR